MQDMKSLVWLFLVITGASATDVRRVKREDDGGDIMDNLKDMAENLKTNLDNLANAGQQTAANLAKQILENSGFDVKGLPKDLMQPASNLFQLRTTETFQNMIKSIRNKMKSNMELDTLNTNFEKLLTNADFMKEAKKLMDDNNGDMDDPSFKSDMETIMQKYFDKMGGTAATLSVSLASVLLLSVVHFIL